MTTQNRVAEIEARCSKATEGPLLFRNKSTSFHEMSDEYPYGAEAIGIGFDDDGSAFIEIDDGDVELIKNAQVDIAALLQLIRSQEIALTRAVKTLQHYDEWLFDVAEGEPARDALADIAKLREVKS